ncbi:MAG: T9SS type A sorting domain-containing protein, partial [Candidatus Margulisbacteria bacterium]|nr:T9SS type A sorting domain-containing protein [Candidatus Margulisiibacteriota bacterium]
SNLVIEFYKVNTWNNVIANQDSDYYWDVQNNRGPRSAVDVGKYLWLADEDGTKNIQVVFADDFGRPYESPSANEISWTYYQTNRDNVSANGQYPVFSAQEKIRLDGIPVPDWPTRAVFIELLPAVDNHQGATANAVIVLDRQVNPGTAWVANLVTGNFVGTQDVIVAIRHQDPLELSGITHVYLTGSVKDIENNGNNNKLITFNSTITNNVVIRVTELNATKSILVYFKDRAGNVGGQVTVNVYYESIIQYDNPQYRIKFENASYYISTTNVVVNLNFPGANIFHVSGNLEGGYISMPYDTQVKFRLSSGDGVKNFGMWLEDRYIITDVYPHDFLLDTNSPIVSDNINTTDFYYGDTGAWIGLFFNDNPNSIVNVAALKQIFYKINDYPTKSVELKDVYGYYTTPEQYAITVNIKDKGINNRIKYWAEDMAGNISIKKEVTGIKVNSAYPQPISVIPVGGYTYSDNPGVYYVKSSQVTLNCFALNSDRIWLAGDIVENGTGPYGIPLNSYFNQVVNLTGADGEKIVTVSFGDELSAVGGLIAHKTIKLILDRVPPDAVTLVQPSSTPYNSNYKTILLRVQKNGVEAPSTSVLVNNNQMNNIASNQAELLVTLGAPGVTTNFNIVARDRAGNESTALLFQGIFNSLGGLNVLAGSLPVEVASIDVASMNALDTKFSQANQNVKGIKNREELAGTVRQFEALDAFGQAINDENIYAGATIEIIIPLPENLGGANPYDLRIFYFNESTAKWEIVEGEIKLNMEEGTISIVVTHLSYYRVFELIPFATNLSGLKVYPNPYRPDDGNISTGDDNSRFITFEGLTDTSKIKIYTISGELVRVLDEGTAIVEWQADNMDDEKVASGIYIYIITDKDGNKKMGRITIIRDE